MTTLGKLNNMNIFFLDKDPYKAAEYLCDKHVVKLVLESAQIMSTVYNLSHDKDLDFTYRTTHKNHPCTIWARECFENYQWLSRHAVGLLLEYTHRYNKIHASTDIITRCCYVPDSVPINGEMTPPAQAMPEEYRNEDPVVAYRDYYFYDKRLSIDCSWNKTRSSPEWWNRMLALEELTQQAQDLSMGYGQ